MEDCGAGAVFFLLEIGVYSVVLGVVDGVGGEDSLLIWKWHLCLCLCLSLGGYWQ